MIFSMPKKMKLSVKEVTLLLIYKVAWKRGRKALSLPCKARYFFSIDCHITWLLPAQLTKFRNGKIFGAVPS